MHAGGGGAKMCFILDNRTVRSHFISGQLTALISHADTPPVLGQHLLITHTCIQAHTHRVDLEWSRMSHYCLHRKLYQWGRGEPTKVNVMVWKELRESPFMFPVLMCGLSFNQWISSMLGQTRWGELQIVNDLPSSKTCHLNTWSSSKKSFMREISFQTS